MKFVVEFYKLLFFPFVMSFILINDSDKHIDKSLNKFTNFHSLWLTWQPWSNNCERNCSQKFGKRFRERKCFNCSKQECFKVDNSKCSKQTSHSREIQFCYQG